MQYDCPDHLLQAPPRITFRHYRLLASLLDQLLCGRFEGCLPTGEDAAAVAALAFKDRLALSFRRLLAINGCLPPADSQLAQVLELLYANNCARAVQIQTQLRELLRVLAPPPGLPPPLLLKAASVYMAEGTELIEDRIFWDLDVVVGGDRFSKAQQALLRAGYGLLEECSGSLHHATLLASGRPCPVELHRDLFGGLGRRYLETGEAVSRGVRGERGSEAYLRLCPEHELVYQIVHGFVHHPGYITRQTPLRVLFDIARLWREQDGDLALSAARKRFSVRGMGALFDNVLGLGAELFPRSITLPHRPRLRTRIYLGEVAAATSHPAAAMLLRGINAFALSALEERFQDRNVRAEIWSARRDVVRLAVRTIRSPELRRKLLARYFPEQNSTAASRNAQTAASARRTASSS